MGLIDRAKNAQIERFTEESRQLGANHDYEQALEIARLTIITQRFVTLAMELNVDFESLTTSPVAMPRYYRLDEIVLMAQWLNSKKKEDPNKPNHVGLACGAHLVGVNAREKLDYRHIGTVQCLDFDGITRAISDAPPNFDFRATTVYGMLPTLS